MREVAVLIPTTDRATALATTLTSLCFQEFKGFDVIISDQSEGEDPFKNPTITCIVRLLEKKGHTVKMFKNLPKKGIAQNRQFLLDKSNYKYSLFLDDDLILEDFVISNMRRVILEEKCGFVGCAPIGLSYRHDNRPDEQEIEFWNKRVETEKIDPDGRKWKRHLLHNASNVLHVEEKFGLHKGQIKKYKIAWIGGCVMYDTKKLKETGGFKFWRKISQNHAGEDVFVQFLLLEKYGGCGILPSGVYHQEVPTTINDRRVNALSLY